jgi:competence/damage-inducible protein CinA-like protein
MKNKTYKISIISIGDELVIGQTVNTNASFIAEKLTEIGAEVLLHSVIRDGKNEIIDEIKKLSKKSDLIIMTGGLGPTSDDITKEVLSDYFSDQLELDEELYDMLEKRYLARGFKQVSKSLTWQCTLPTKCKLFPNDVGAAPAMLFDKNNFKLISLPGVPSEMKSILENSIINFVSGEMKSRKSDIMIFRSVRTANITESSLAEKIGDEGCKSNLGENVSLAYLPSYQGVKLRLGTISEDLEIGKNILDYAQNTLDNKISEFIAGYGNRDLVEIISEILTKNKLSLSVAESCSSGMLGAKLTEFSGASDWFLGGVMSYSNDVKIKLLGVNPDILNTYGAVSELCAIKMAEGVRKNLQSDIGISITGIAGSSGGSEEKPVGTIWIGFSDKTRSFARHFLFGSERDFNRKRSVGMALMILYKQLKDKEN